MGVIDRAGIDFAKAEHGIYFTGTGRGWGIGHAVPGEVSTTAEMVKSVGLDWEVDAVPMSDLLPDHPGAGAWKVNVRRDTRQVLGPVGSGWTSPSNVDAFGFVDELLDSGDAKWLAGGCLKGGATVFGIAQIDRAVCLRDNDDETIQPFLFLRNGWNGGTSLSIEIIPMRLICTNGMTMPVAGLDRKWKARHTKGIQMRTQTARKSLELTIAYMGTFEAEMLQLLDTSWSERQFDRLVDRAIPYPTKGAGETDDERKARERKERRADEQRQLFRQVWETSPDLQAIRDTAYGAYNAVTEFYDWHAGSRKSVEEARFVKVLDDAYGRKAVATEHLRALAHL